MAIHPIVADGEACPSCGAEVVGNFDPVFEIEMPSENITRFYFKTGPCNECGWSNRELLTG